MYEEDVSDELKQRLRQLCYDWGINYTDLALWDKEEIRENLENLQMDVAGIIDLLLE